MRQGSHLGRHEVHVEEGDELEEVQERQLHDGDVHDRRGRELDLLVQEPGGLLPTCRGQHDEVLAGGEHDAEGYLEVQAHLHVVHVDGRLRQLKVRALAVVFDV